MLIIITICLKIQQSFSKNRHIPMSYRKPYYYEKSGSLDLRGYHPSQWIPILNSTNWEHIKTIQLERGKVTEDNIYQFIKSDWPNLQNIDLNQNDLGDDGVDRLLCKDMPALKTLMLSETNTTVIALRPLLNITWSNLLNLSLSRNQLRSQGIKLLVKADMPALLHLSLTNCGIGQEGLKHLCKGKWKHLQTLNPRMNNGNLTGHLSIFGHWTEIQHLFIGQFNQQRYIYPNIPINVLTCIAIQPSTKLFATVENQQLEKVLSKLKRTYNQ